jgi:hypothetical protein
MKLFYTVRYKVFKAFFQIKIIRSLLDMTSKDIDKFEVYSAYDMRNTDLRNYLNTLFGLRCIFPSFGVSKYGNTARVILERMTPSIVLEENMTEDMICRLYRQSRTAEGNDEIILSFDEKLVTFCFEHPIIFICFAR